MYLVVSKLFDICIIMGIKVIWLFHLIRREGKGMKGKFLVILYLLSRLL